ncbi:arabinosyltransferase domain-containing protein [Actinomycetospora corticicola]|uniref:Arabinosyltransferase B/arabinosyltransferase C n=1 Tax=Actinomycetospora corticicola TaxID=663602 RepID=A0A7Y9J7L5_9PSEU|nr:arabinosyltransferase domain-containing protein [Actinomycetospora corticicola]NYD38530.1 arabinosyltransferase B/arabinosyltransferase C [Actinomycetospora corticicola]
MAVVEDTPVRATEGPPRSTPGTTVRSGWFLAALAAVTVLLGVAIPFAPVTADDPVVTWPKAGQPAASTSVPLVPYRPLAMTAEVPCQALRGGGDALRTQPTSAGTPGRGLTVSNSGGRVTVTSDGATLVDEVLPLTPCVYRFANDGTTTTLSRDGQQLYAAPGQAPQVAELATDAPGTPGLAATIHPDDRYSSVPSGLKLTLLILHVLALAATLVLAGRRWWGRGGHGFVRPRFHGADVAVGVVSAAWVILSPLQNDDSWYLLMARNAGATGYVGNQIYMFDTTENPFVGSQYLMSMWGSVGNWLGMPGWGLLWMRCLPLLLGLLTWFLLRGVLSTALGRIERRRWVPWTLLGAHLAWFLPYGMALRPEVFIVPVFAAVLLLAEIARRREAVGPLILATALAALSVTISPSGLVSAAPVVVTLPWLFRWLKTTSWRTRLGVVGAVIAAGTIAIPVGFGDATFGDVVEATGVHSWYYVTFPWYEEWAHYRTLIETGTWGRRLPVLLTLVLLVIVSIGSGRRGRSDGPIHAYTLSTAVTTAVALFLLALGPTKWVNHFGAIAAPGTLLLTLAMLQTPLPRRPGALVTGAGVALLTGATVLGFAGPNVWKPYSDRGQPFGKHLDPDMSMLDMEGLAPHIGPFFLRQFFWWIGLALLAALFVAWRRRNRRPTFGITPDRAVLVPSVVMTALLMVAVMVYAPVIQAPGWSVAGAQLQALVGRPCQLSNSVEVMERTPADLGGPVTPAVATGDFALTQPGNGGPDEAPVPPPGPAPGGSGPELWHDAVTSDPNLPQQGTGLGTLTTGWYPVPAQSTATHVVVPVAGNDPNSQRIVLEFGYGPAAAPTRTTAVTVNPAPGLTARQWQEVPVLLPGERPTAVRLVAEDRVAGPDTALAVAPPHLAAMQPVQSLVGPDSYGHDPETGPPVFADQLSAVLWPCVNQVAVAHGIAPTPVVRLQAAENTPEFILTNPTYESWGGTMVQSERTWATVRIYSTVTAGGPPTLQWGNVDRIVYDHPTDNYDLTVGSVIRSGLTRFPTLATEAYSGREYLG